MDIELNIGSVIKDKIRKDSHEIDKKFIVVKGIKSHVFGKGEYWDRRSVYKQKLGYHKKDLALRADLDYIIGVRQSIREMGLQVELDGLALNISGDVVCYDGVFSCYYGCPDSRYYSCNREVKRKNNIYLLKRKDGT